MWAGPGPKQRECQNIYAIDPDGMWETMSDNVRIVFSRWGSFEESKFWNTCSCVTSNKTWEEPVLLRLWTIVDMFLLIRPYIPIVVTRSPLCWLGDCPLSTIFSTFFYILIIRVFHHLMKTNHIATCTSFWRALLFSLPSLHVVPSWKAPGSHPAHPT
jgi:hypothetical protein